jgi:hypothetical protein
MLIMVSAKPVQKRSTLSDNPEIFQAITAPNIDSVTHCPYGEVSIANIDRIIAGVKSRAESLTKYY